MSAENEVPEIRSAAATELRLLSSEVANRLNCGIMDGVLERLGTMAVLARRCGGKKDPDLGRGAEVPTMVPDVELWIVKRDDRPPIQPDEKSEIPTHMPPDL